MNVHFLQFRRPWSPALALASLAALSALGCRSSFGVDPLTDPDNASRLPGYWNMEIRGGFGGVEMEKYHLQFDGEKAWIFASRPDGAPEGGVSFSREVSLAEFESFTRGALGLDPYHWYDRRAQGPGSFETLNIRFQVADRSHSAHIEGPDSTERLLFERLRTLAGAPVRASNATAGGR